MSLISIWDLEILPGKKFSKNSLLSKRAIQILKKNKDVKIQDYEEVADNPLSFLLACHEALCESEKKMGNNNNPEGK